MEQLADLRERNGGSELAVKLHDLSATALREAYAAKTLSPVEVTRAVLAHIARWEPHLHATYALDADAALTQAEASQARWLKLACHRSISPWRCSYSTWELSWASCCS